MAAMYDDGRLMRSWQGGRARHLAVAADHAWLVEACVRLSELTGDTRCGGAGPTGWRTNCSSGSGTTSRVASSRPATMRKRSSCGPRSISTARSPPPIRSPSTPFCGPTPSMMTSGSATPPSAPSPKAAALLDAPPRRAGRPGGRAAHARRPPGDRGHRATDPTSWPRCAASGCPGPSWPGAIRTTSPLFDGRPEGAAFVCRGFSCNAPAGDPPTLREQLEGLPR